MPEVLTVFPGEPLYQEKVQLEGKDYIFHFDWSEREQRYYLTLRDSEETTLLRGIKVTSNWGLTTRQRYNPNLPPGELIAIDLEGGGPPTIDDFGTRVRLFYYSSDEIAGLVQFA